MNKTVSTTLVGGKQFLDTCFSHSNSSLFLVVTFPILIVSILHNTFFFLQIVPSYSFLYVHIIN